MSQVVTCPTCGAGTKAKKTKDGQISYTVISDEARSKKIGQLKKALGAMRAKNDALQAELDRLKQAA